MDTKAICKKIYYKHSNKISKLFYLFGKNSKKIKGKNNVIEHSEALLKNVEFNIFGNSNKVIIKKGTRISNAKIIIYGSNHQLTIGGNCIINSGTFWFEDEYCKIFIGDNTTISGAGIAVTEPKSSIEIGQDCMLSSGIDIRNGDSHSIIDLKSNERINYAKDVFIDNHVWIGTDVRILKGSKINTGSVIASNSVVTQEIPRNCVAGGIPTKVIKENINWNRERIYER